MRGVAVGIRDDLQADIAEAYDDADGLADAVRSFTGSREVPGEYDPVTGTSATTVAYSGRGVFGSFRQEEVDGQHILATDEKLSGVLQNELIHDSDGTPAAPMVDDVVDGKRVTAVMQDPASATWSMALRRT